VDPATATKSTDTQLGGSIVATHTEKEMEVEHALIFDYRIGRVAMVMDGCPIIFELLLPTVTDPINIALLLKAYTPETSLLSEMVFTLDTLAKALPSDVVEGAMVRRGGGEGEEEGGGRRGQWECRDMPSMTTYISKHLRSVVGIYRMGCRISLYLLCDEAEKKRRQQNIDAEALKKNHVSDHTATHLPLSKEPMHNMTSPSVHISIIPHLLDCCRYIVGCSQMEMLINHM